MESNRATRKAYIENQTDNDIAKALKEYPDRDEVMFTSGEPTMNQKLESYICWAKEQGFRVISIISNGRRLCYAGYAQNLLQLGVNKLTVSLHGHTASLHDGLTGAKGAFDQASAGLSNLKRLKTKYKFELHTSTVVVRKNLPHLHAIHDFLERYAPDRICFNVMMAKGRGIERFAQLMPRYSQVAESMAELVRGLSERQLMRLSLVDIPRCAARQLPLSLLGTSERYQQFEPTGSLGIGGLGQKELFVRAKNGEIAARTLLHLAQHAKLLSDQKYYLTARESKDDLLRTKRRQCDSCAVRHECPGVWAAYADQVGWDEFNPIS